MRINFDKSALMKITHKKLPWHFTCHVKDILLSEVSNYKCLGLYISNDLCWEKRITYVTTDANHKPFFLRRALKLSTLSVRLLAYK